MARGGRRRRRRGSEAQGDMLNDVESTESTSDEEISTEDGAEYDETPPEEMEESVPAEEAVEAPPTSSGMEVVAEPRVTIPVSQVARRVAELETQSDYAEALALVRDARIDRTADPELLLLEIHLLGLTGRFDEAEEPLRTLRLAEGERMEVHRAAGILAFRRRKHDDAEAELRAALEVGDDSGETHYYLGETLNRENRVEEALEILRVGVELNPDDPRIYKTMGRLMDRKGEMADAAVMYRKARELEG